MLASPEYQLNIDRIIIFSVPDPDPPDSHVFGPSVDVLKVNDENSRIRIRIRFRIHQSEAWIRESGSSPKCHGSGTLINIIIIIINNYDMNDSDMKSE
jgi:hypothetical protein